MHMTNDSLENLWDGLLSHDPSRIQSTFTSLDASDQRSVLFHLQRMVHETGWLPVQKQSAKIALDVLKNIVVDSDQTQV